MEKLFSSNKKKLEKPNNIEQKIENRKNKMN